MRQFICFILGLILYVPLSSAYTAKVAIIIDDIGYRATDSQALTLPGNISYSILPHTPYGQELAYQAQADNKDVLLHIPMEATNGKKLGPGALTSDMNARHIYQKLQQAFNEIPFAKGINNHMGSKLTQMPYPMSVVMRYLKQHNLIFVDSLTTPKSKAGKIARDHGVLTQHREVFLDNQLDESYIKKQFKQLIKLAHQNPNVIAIAHPHPETIKALKKLIPLLKQENIELVSISAIFQQKAQTIETTVIGKE